MSILLIIILALLIWWGIATTNANNERAAVVQSNFAGKTMSFEKETISNYYDSWSIGSKTTITDKYEFKVDGTWEKTYIYLTLYNEKSKEYGATNIYDTFTSEGSYYVHISLFGSIYLYLDDGTPFKLEVDSNNKPISMEKNGDVYD